MTYTVPTNVVMESLGDGSSKLGRDVNANSLEGKNRVIADAQRRFYTANPNDMLGYILVVAQLVPNDAGAVETIVDFGGSPATKLRMLDALATAVGHDEAAQKNGDQK